MASDSNIDRFLLAIGGTVGFGSTFLNALGSGGDDVSGALLRGSVGMIAGVILVKLLIMTAHAVFREARREKMLTAVTKENEGTESSPPASEDAPDRHAGGNRKARV